MQVTLTLSEKEIDFLKKLMASRNRLEGKEHSIEDVIHECIKMTMFDEGEHGVSAT